MVARAQGGLGFLRVIAKVVPQLCHAINSDKLKNRICGHRRQRIRDPDALQCHLATALPFWSIAELFQI